MCRSDAGPELCRLSAVDAFLKPVCDILVKPAVPITNYLTEFSGITEEMLASVTTTREEAVQQLEAAIPEGAILVGHSLENDLQAMGIVYDKIIDTSLLFPHPRPGLKSGLKFLAKTILKENMMRAQGHDSCEDARTAMKLAVLKFQKGPTFGGNHAAPTVSLGTALKENTAEFACSVSVADSRAKPSSPWFGNALENVEYREADSDQKAVLMGVAAIKSRTTPKHIAVAHLRSYQKVCESQSEAAMMAPSHEPTLAKKKAAVAEVNLAISHAVSQLGPRDLLIVWTASGDCWTYLKLLGASKNNSLPESGVRALELGKNAAETPFWAVTLVSPELIQIAEASVGVARGAAEKQALEEKKEAQAAAAAAAREAERAARAKPTAEVAAWFGGSAAAAPDAW